MCAFSKALKEPTSFRIYLSIVKNQVTVAHTLSLSEIAI